MYEGPQLAAAALHSAREVAPLRARAGSGGGIAQIDLRVTSCVCVCVCAGRLSREDCWAYEEEDGDSVNVASPVSMAFGVAVERLVRPARRREIFS